MVPIFDRPSYCQYTSQECDQEFVFPIKRRGLFLYPSHPKTVADTIREAIIKLNFDNIGDKWYSWEDLPISGQIIFCEICKGIRSSKLVIADVTTLNRNLLFEIGYTIGLGIPVIPIRDSTVTTDETSFRKLGFLETLGYLDFQNSNQLKERILEDEFTRKELPTSDIEMSKTTPAYFIKGPIQTEGEIKLQSALKKNPANYRVYDTVETPRISLHEVIKQVKSSYGIIAHLLSKDRRDSVIHNARCSLIAGFGMSAQKIVLLLEQDTETQPIDYRDIIISYTDFKHINIIVARTVYNILKKFQSTGKNIKKLPKGTLEKIDLGDFAAENELALLNDYFVMTSQFKQARNGHARIVIGRKGSGKTAIFYALKEELAGGHSRLILDLKPEAHQLVKLKEQILDHQSAGLKEHTLTAFWNMILLTEVSHRIIQDDENWAIRDQVRAEKFAKLKQLNNEFAFIEIGDFAERLHHQVELLISQYDNLGKTSNGRQLTEILYSDKLNALSYALNEYLAEKDEIWILIDNLDKGWPIRGTKENDILIIKALLEASRKLQRRFQKTGLNFHCILFIRNDIYDHLLDQTPDKNKDYPISLEWPDPEFFKKILVKRIEANNALNGTFEEIWTRIFPSTIGIEDSFQYVLSRTLMRPRDYLMFVHRSIETAINRGHDKVEEEDLLFAEKQYSNDLTQYFQFELQDVFTKIPDFIYSFLGEKYELQKQEIEELLTRSKVKTANLNEAISFLCWYGFLGIYNRQSDQSRFSFDLNYDMRKLMLPIKKGEGFFIIHPAFRSYLECVQP